MRREEIEKFEKEKLWGNFTLIDPGKTFDTALTYRHRDYSELKLEIYKGPIQAVVTVETRLKKIQGRQNFSEVIQKVLKPGGINNVQRVYQVESKIILEFRDLDSAIQFCENYPYFREGMFNIIRQKQNKLTFPNRSQRNQHHCGEFSPGFHAVDLEVYHGTGIKNLDKLDTGRELELLPHLKRAPLKEHGEYKFPSISTTCNKMVALGFAKKSLVSVILTYQLKTDQLYVPKEYGYPPKDPEIMDRIEAFFIPNVSFSESEIAVLNPDILTLKKVEYYYNGKLYQKSITPESPQVIYDNLKYLAKRITSNLDLIKDLEQEYQAKLAKQPLSLWKDISMGERRFGEEQFSLEVNFTMKSPFNFVNDMDEFSKIESRGAREWEKLGKNVIQEFKAYLGDSEKISLESFSNKISLSLDLDFLDNLPQLRKILNTGLEIGLSYGKFMDYHVEKQLTKTSSKLVSLIKKLL